MNVDDLFGVLLLFISILGALLFFIATLRKEGMTSKLKNEIINKKLKIR